VSGVEVYRGAFGRDQAERLLWRAGFGPRPGQVAELARLGLDGAVRSLTQPGPERLTGPLPRDDKGRPIAPRDRWGHDHLWWLDRMVRTSRPLVERMTLVWHDWFATSNAGVGSQKLMLDQNELFRRHALGSFSDLLLDVTKDPAMLLWLSGSNSTRWAPNENYARELMELFTLGAGRGYSEDDVRAQARSLTGWRNDWKESKGPVNFRFDNESHDGGVKKVFGKRGRFDWKDSCRLCLENPKHASFFVSKLWSYFIPVAPKASTSRALEQVYVSKGHAVQPLVEAILRHPALYTGPRMVKPPIVYTAGLLRGRGRGVDTDAWSWLGSLAGQQLFYPPNVAGWEDDRWLDTASFRGLWATVNHAAKPYALDAEKEKRPLDPDKLVDNAVRFWGSPAISGRTRRALHGFATDAFKTANERWKKEAYPTLVENALRQLVAVSPDFLTS
jgi:uncharacterized protein (DUF1800 family)